MAKQPANSAPLQVTEAVARILADVRALGPINVALLDAHNMVLAADAVAPVTLPPWDNSAMDGYAARAADMERAAEGPNGRITLTVVESVAAGQFPTKPIGPGEVTRIFTGAPLAAGADTVVRQEDTEPGPPGRVTIVRGRDARKNVRHRGEDIRKDTVVLAAGTPLGPAQLGVLASIAHGSPLVHGAPRS